MKRILVMSDTHGNQQLLRIPFEHGDHFTHIFHLGDDYEDLDSNPDLTENRLLTRVPGIFHPGYLDSSLPRLVKVEIDGWRFLLMHSPDDARGQKLDNIDFVLFGHTHRPGIEMREGRFWCNPGHLKRRFDRGQSASWLVIELEGDEARLSLYDIYGTLMICNTITR
ncbi:MAG: metallophosphoesterase family protein [Candidatus Cloacimonetes bacterium]|nr:metallophosphoesterase family protein [Candidatus Cloacimonadota bacterium]